ncbi:MAG: ABC transporter ATP-binding protein [Candidatus Hodarchaeales archaeon]|jgi:putative ABC transport system ATP-binding protein
MNLESEESQVSGIKLTNISKEYRLGNLKISVLRNLDIITGFSGSGKSTILSIIGGLTRIDEGNARVLDHDLHTMDEEDLAIFRSINVGFVFQTGHLLDSLTVLENILLPVELAQQNREGINFDERAKQLLKEFKLDERADSLPIMLSGGEYQRTVFVRALILNPDLLLIDEPTSNQDNLTTESIVKKLSKMKGKKTIIVVTHDRRIFPLADQKLIPKEGKLVPFEE